VFPKLSTARTFDPLSPEEPRDRSEEIAFRLPPRPLSERHARQDL